MIVNKTNAACYQWGNKCEGWRLLQTGSLSVIEERMPPGTSEVRHYHNHAQQVFYILSGTLFFEKEKTGYVLQRGDSIHVPPGVTHQVKNNSDDHVTFLVISEPTTQGDRIENI